MSAAFGGQSEAIVFLLEKGADPFAVDSSGRNALHHLMMTDLEIQDEDDEKALALFALRVGRLILLVFQPIKINGLLENQH